MLKRRKTFILVTVLLTFVCLKYYFSANAAPGDNSDPLVSKSYVDQFFRFRPVVIDAGNYYATDKGTELVLRSGQATVFAKGGGGLADLTAGKDCKDGECIMANHHLLSAQGDGRGIFAVTKVTVLIRGTGKIVNNSLPNKI